MTDWTVSFYLHLYLLVRSRLVSQVILVHLSLPSDLYPPKENKTVVKFLFCISQSSRFRHCGADSDSLPGSMAMQLLPHSWLKLQLRAPTLC